MLKIIPVQANAAQGYPPGAFAKKTEEHADSCKGDEPDAVLYRAISLLSEHGLSSPYIR